MAAQQGPNWVKAIAGGLATFGVGYVIMRATTPSDKAFYDSLSPELKKAVDEQRSRATKQAAYVEQLARARQQDEEQVVWAAADARDKTPPQK